MSGTYADKRTPSAVQAAFLLVALVLVLVPSVGMLWARTDATTENRELAPEPVLFDEAGAFNIGFLADAGTYFEDHFAYRNELVTADARLRSMLGSSSTDQVVVGSDGWLYYAGTLNDYLGRSKLTDRSLANIAHNLKLVQGYVESKGASFALAIAPNKNTLYDEHMPSHYVKSLDASNAERLKPLLEQAGVNYVDLFDTISSQGETLYLKRDTHWDNRGALLAADAIMKALGRDPVSADTDEMVAVDDFVGDLEGMLFPGENRTETNYYFEGYHSQASSSDDADAALKWEYIEGSNVDDNTIATAGTGQGSLYMFRDSFGNALVPFLATSFKEASFSKLVPSYIPSAVKAGADCVVIERAERHLADFATNPPVISNPTLKFSGGIPENAREVEASLECEVDGSYWVVRGTVGEQLGTGERLYLVAGSGQADPVVYDPFYLSFADESGEVVGDAGLLVYIPVSSSDIDVDDLRVYARS